MWWPTPSWVCWPVVASKQPPWLTNGKWDWVSANCYCGRGLWVTVGPVTVGPVGGYFFLETILATATDPLTPMSSRIRGAGLPGYMIHDGAGQIIITTNKCDNVQHSSSPRMYKHSGFCVRHVEQMTAVHRRICQQSFQISSKPAGMTQWHSGSDREVQDCIRGRGRAGYECVSVVSCQSSVSVSQSGAVLVHHVSDTILWVHAMTCTSIHYAIPQYRFKFWFWFWSKWVLVRYL